MTPLIEVMNRAIKADPRAAWSWHPAPYTNTDKDDLTWGQGIEVWSGVCKNCAKSTMEFAGPAEQYIDYVLSRVDRSTRLEICGDDYNDDL